MPWKNRTAACLVRRTIDDDDVETGSDHAMLGHVIETLVSGMRVNHFLKVGGGSTIRLRNCEQGNDQVRSGASGENDSACRYRTTLAHLWFETPLRERVDGDRLKYGQNELQAGLGQRSIVRSMGIQCFR
jgi:hypothetical protein